MTAQHQDVVKRKIAQARLLPVVVLDSAAQALPLADALAEGGLPVAEVTFRTDAAAESIKAIAQARPDMVVGAGTVLSADHVARAVEAGAQFLVSPGFNPAVVAAAQEAGIPIVPGVNSPTNVEAAMAMGLKLLKFFPAEVSGGIPMLKSLSGPYGNVSFIPTGGIGPKNLNDYLALSNVLACGGSWMVDRKTVAAGQFDEITRLTRAAVALAAK
ncbi:bifunctional 4-hydroxy-2-oxoglutarate aldolase/2-dehydro-3-deoxy-phosphogluconate aldolase [Pacificoceanicola onchidii]|uniref:bifunctional 4-hydroxy-2-oxoglutarate aldolase/2-dehydro-3-deoxy-phosphogluconate aldolase n=1 Tax=Pacificoceanicola onchidii TaxID=2562685 RepID=UPI0010A5AF1D|nr:bifunctional 4-hydroxy-2-oxoglutarate aldolase/2-dehydro-3-deoxy-phosphogluconate aldolase [Pacificoceanicola onchidii]